jgi:hypothetical protein
MVNSGWRSRLVGFGLAAAAVSLVVAPAGAEGFYPVGGMYTSRISAAAVALADGNVLVVSDNSVEKFYWSGRAFGVVAFLSANHGSGLTATLLADGRVPIVGGQSGDASLTTAEIFDPQTNGVTPTGGLSTPRSFHTATLLGDGRVLVAGGHRYNFYNSALATAEVYDPATGSFSPAGDMASARQDATATRLPDGRVLVAGGYGGDQIAQATSELFDPTTGSFSAAASMAVGRANHTATALADGSVLVTGGHASAPGPSVASAEVYDPAAAAFLPTGDMSSPRGAQTATLLDDGRVLVAGGFTDFPYAPTLATAEIWDPSTGVFTMVAHGMRDARGRHVAAALPGGEVLVAGGFALLGSPGWSAEAYSPTFVDSQPPLLYAPNDITQAANPAFPTGDYVYFYPWASDNIDANPVVSCQPPSGTLFPVGTTLVTCTATDSWGNSTSASFHVTILPPLALTFTVDAFGAVDPKTGVATVSGTVTCSRPASAAVNGQMSQVVASRATLTGYIYGSGACGPQPTRWTATVSAPNGRFISGRADLIVWPTAYDNYSYVSTDVIQKTIQLRAKK